MAPWPHLLPSDPASACARETVNAAETETPFAASAGRQTEESLAHLRRQNDLILHAAGEGIYGLDRESRTTFINPAVTQMLGWTSEDIVGHDMHDIIHHTKSDGSPYPPEECPIYTAFRDGKVHNVGGEHFWRKDGTPLPVEYTSTPIRENGELTGAVVVFRDITERKLAELERRKAFEEMARLKYELKRERDYLREEVAVALNFGEIIGRSAALNRVLARMEAVAMTTATVLVLGDSGVGKELVARAIHAQSLRSARPLVKVNCASIPRDLFESKFFGHVKGAFTGAHRSRVGRFQLADGGTLFLDEVGEIPLELQGKLLRVLQEQSFERIGEGRAQNVDVRIIAATNRDLKGEVDAGRFRRDLCYRLNVFPIEIPPFRARKDDIVPLAMHFLDHACGEFDRRELALSRHHSVVLLGYDWAGNVRELKNVIERAVIFSPGDQLRLELAFPEARLPTRQGNGKVPGRRTPILTAAELRAREPENIIATLPQTAGKISGRGGAAELIGVHASTLSSRIRALHIAKHEIAAVEIEP